MSLEKALYVVATPIGNLGDMVPRAIEALQFVDLIAAEDTRHSRGLLDHFGIKTPVVSFHEHSDPRSCEQFVSRLVAGESIALISDAGTPLISDPGYVLVLRAHQLGIKVVPIPGSCAAVAALSVSGLSANKFTFEGFLPAKKGTRSRALEALVDEPRTMIFYEAPHRVAETVAAMAEIFGEDRPAAVARELTKLYETVKRATLGELSQWICEDANQRRGELVVMVEGRERPVASLDAEVERTLFILAEELPASQAAAVAARLSGVPRKQLYQRLLAGGE